MEWISLASNLVLVLVTSAYVVLTWKMSQSSSESAKSAQRAAEAAERSAIASIATVEVAFDLSPGYSFEVGEGTGGKLSPVITCTGATVYVHGAELQAAYFQVKYGDEEADSGISYYPRVLGPYELRICEGPSRTNIKSGSVRLHKAESVDLDGNPQIFLNEKQFEAGIARLEVDVFYSLGRDEPPVRRRCEWSGSKGVDFSPLELDDTPGPE